MSIMGLCGFSVPGHAPHLLKKLPSCLSNAAFGWSAFKHLTDERIEIIEMPQEQQVLRGTGVGLLSFSKQPETAKKFMDFLASPESQKFYAEYGWVL